jgi:hypothetical protein
MKDHYVSCRGYAPTDGIFYELNEVSSLVS